MSLAPQCYAGLVSSGFLAEDDDRRQRVTIHSFRSFIYSLPTQQDCVLPVVGSRRY